MNQAEQPYRILGIDPGLNTTGYGVIEITPREVCLIEAGVVRSKPKDPLALKVKAIYDGVADVVKSLSPTAMSLEELYSHYNQPKTAILMGHARGAICLAAIQAEVETFHYSATQIKKTITGSGRASKEQIQGAIQREFHLAEPPEPADVADALAIALTHHFLTSNSSILL